MNVALIVLWALTGFSAAVGFSSGSASLPNPDDPNPPLCAACVVIGIVAGCLGGWAYTQMFVTQDARSGVYAATTSLGAFVVARVVVSIFRAVTKRAS